MKKYSFLFSAIYLFLALVLAAVAEFLKLKGGGSLGIIPVFGASFFAAWKFTKDYEREPSSDEKKSFAWQALLGIWVVSLLIAVVILFAFLPLSDAYLFFEQSATKTFLSIFAVLALIISVICYIAIRWSFSWYAKQYSRSNRAA